jgi:hypothetical protein
MSDPGGSEEDSTDEQVPSTVDPSKSAEGAQPRKKRKRRKTSAQKNRSKQARKALVDATDPADRPPKHRKTPWRSHNDKWQGQVSGLALIAMVSPGAVWDDPSYHPDKLAAVRSRMERDAPSYLDMYRITPPDFPWAIPNPLAQVG